MSRKSEKNTIDREYDTLLLSVREVMKSAAGKTFIWAVLEKCDIYTDKFTGNSTTFMLLGKERVGLDILQLLEDANPELYPLMLLERAKKLRRDNSNSKENTR